MSSQFSLFNSGIVAESRAIHALLQQIDVAARCDFTILVSGESGTGKELVARAIHEQSARAMKPFVSINCGTKDRAPGHDTQQRQLGKTINDAFRDPVRKVLRLRVVTNIDKREHGQKTGLSG